VNFLEQHWFLKDLQYFYLDDGFKLVAYTDVPCHLFCRMTSTPPRKHALPSYRRGLYLQGDIRFCFVVYEDNEQDEAGDTLIHTFYKSAWPVCETRWFYFIGNIAGISSVSESPIFTFHFPAPPPEPPPPLDAYFYATASNRDIRSNDVAWPICRAGARLTVSFWHDAPLYRLFPGAWLTVSYFINRSFLFFDTSTLPDTTKILSAEFLPFVEWHRRTSSAAYPHIQITKGLAIPPIVIGDYLIQTNETLVLGQIDLGTITDGQYNSIPLNQDGINHINLTGVTKYCIRQEMDILNIVPPLGVNDLWSYSEQKGAGYRPMLHVQYYLA